MGQGAGCVGGGGAAGRAVCAAAHLPHPPTRHNVQMCDEDPYILPDQDLSLWSQGGHLGQQVQRANWQVANVSTPANYFHLLRRQLHRSFRKVGGVGRWGGGGGGGAAGARSGSGGWRRAWPGRPARAPTPLPPVPIPNPAAFPRHPLQPLIVAAPKNLLRHPAAKSALSEFDDHADDAGIIGARFKRLIMDSAQTDRSPHPPPVEGVKRLVLCSGKASGGEAGLVGVKGVGARVEGGAEGGCCWAAHCPAAITFPNAEPNPNPLAFRSITSWRPSGPGQVRRGTSPWCAWSSWHPSRSTWCAGSCGATPTRRSCGPRRSP